MGVDCRDRSRQSLPKIAARPLDLQADDVTLTMVPEFGTVVV
jgi:hypothetical protein